jgi:hypothetical protein
MGKTMTKEKGSKKTGVTKKAKTTKSAPSKTGLGGTDNTVEIDIYWSNGSLFNTAHGEIDTTNKKVVIEWIDNWPGEPMLNIFDHFQLKTGGQTFNAVLVGLDYPGSPAAFFNLE